MFRFIARFTLTSLAALACPAWAEVALENAQWRVSIDPQTLAIQAAPSGRETVVVSSGVTAHRVEKLDASATMARWQWDDGAYRVEARLDGMDLALTVHATRPGSLDFLHQPGVAMGNGLMLPLAEGRYVPRGDKTWQNFFAEHFAQADSTQNLSLPLWSNAHDGFTPNWLLTEPFHNQLHFRPDGDGIAIGVSHRFTSLEAYAPLTFLLHLGSDDVLAGAKRYRQWLQTTGQFETIADKLRRTPDAEKLLGATHIYVWGDGLLSPRDVKRWPTLLEVLRGNDPFARTIGDRFDADARRLIKQWPAHPTAYEKRALVAALNQALQDEARSRWMHDPADASLLAESYARVRDQAAAVFGQALQGDPSTWGAGVSLTTVERLREAGLARLWLGLGAGWEGGLWHPETVSAAVRAGYLVAPYDSYETALPEREKLDWTTAHLGKKAYEDCAIIRQDGTPQAGFKQSGHYTDPRCVRPLLEARVRAVRQAAPFNSWFLDAYGAGMVFDSYRRDATLTQAQNAAGNVANLRWLTEVLQLPTGSEDGNAVTARGYLFAHGMQTPVMGWGDPELELGTARKKPSPYNLGGWYPSDEPKMFFKQTPMKEPYRTVHFDPLYRLPLYQTVFHDALLTTHHWFFDNLKLTNVHVENELTQLLYNVPPLYHLSEGTLEARLPAMLRMDRFFQPLHRALAQQALTGFAWLSADRLLQQTTFADGTRLVANFATVSRETGGERYPARSITAIRPGGNVLQYRP
ncbi:MAG TPA: glycoside hydrolase [Dyella sp.]|uniref:glycoside hydrolase n=1 Tax=Dyella sp. TaxID=1869338 RepID=UPI002F949040